MTAEQPPSHAKRAAENYAFARAISVGLNAFITGLVATAVSAVLLLWLQKSSGIRLEKSQYGGVLLFIFALITLSAYLVFDFIQHRKEEEYRRRLAASNASRKLSSAPGEEDWGALLDTRLEAFDPLFAESEVGRPATEPAEPSVPAGARKAELTPAAPTAEKPNSTVKDPTPVLFAQAITAAVAAMEAAPSDFLQFGIHLFVAGASSELVSRGVVPPAQGHQTLEAMLLELGLSPRSAAAFAGNANTFAQAPHFRAPIDAGYRAMSSFAQSGFVDVGALPEMLAVWQLQEGICQPPEPVTFVATSVGVPPPGVTVAPEDQQRVMRAHAMVITELLSRFKGREIHNFGNGRIIVFDDTSRAIRAATQFMEAMDKFARTNPKLIVAPRVGVDTDLAAIVAHDYVSAALPRTVSLATITSANCICCTEAAKDDTVDLIEFQPVILAGIYEDLPPLFAAAWNQAPVETTAPPLEYRQVGALSG